MAKSIKSQILEIIKKRPKGTIYFVESFNKIANAKAVNKVLERMVHSNEIHRVTHGIYLRPKIDDYIGEVLPSIEELAVAIAKRDNAKILPSGSYSLYKLGLSLQIPLNIVFYSDTSARKIKIGNQTITFKKASSKNLAYIGEISSLAIQALRTIGKDEVQKVELDQIKKILKNENSKHLEHDLHLAPNWIKNVLTGDV